MARIPRLAVLAAVAFVWTALPAQAEIYRWVDRAGREHFTTDINQVPASQRDAALGAAAARPSINRAESDKEIEGRGQSHRDKPEMECRGGMCFRKGARIRFSGEQVHPQEPSPHELENPRIHGGDENSWRTQHRQHVRRVEELERQVASLEERGADNSPGHRRDNVSRRNYDRYLARHGAWQNATQQLEAARRSLEEFEERARRAGVPPGWLR